MAESIVVGLEGRGTDRYDSKLKPYLVKLLVKTYDDPVMAGQIINSKDACPVRVIAELPPFVRKDDKFDVIVESMDPTVNLEGGTLVDTPLVRYITMPAGMTNPSFRTPSGLVSQGTEGYARGDLTLNAGFRDGARMKGEVPTIGYIPAGAMAAKTWGYRLLLKKPDANTVMLIDAAFKNRFSNLVTTPNAAFLVISMPNRYQGYYKRFLDVVLRIPVRPGTKEERLRRIDGLAAALNAGDPQARYETECALEAYGREAASALVELLRTAHGPARQSALRVLAFVDDARAVDPLIEESRNTQGRFRAESAYLLSILGGDRGDRRVDFVERVNRRLLEMLDDPDAQTRFTALMAIDRTGVKEAPVSIYYSRDARNFAMYLVDTKADAAVVVQSLEGVRRIAIFGRGMRVRCPFKGSVGPVTLTVTPDGIEIQHRRMEKPVALTNHELPNVVSKLDGMFVSVNDIIGLLSALDAKGAMDGKLYWAE
jgi:flagellar basal body P-ring protein FlgI